MITEKELDALEEIIKDYKAGKILAQWIAPISSDMALAMIAEIRSCWSQLDDYHFYAPPYGGGRLSPRGEIGKHTALKTPRLRLESSSLSGGTLMKGDK